MLGRVEPARTASYLDPITLSSTGAAEIHRHGSRPRSTWPRREGSRCLLPSPPLARWQAQLVQTQTDILYLGPMLPGSLSRQSKDPAAATGADGPLSYALTCAAPLVMSGPKRWPTSNPCTLTSGASWAGRPLRRSFPQRSYGRFVSSSRRHCSLICAI